jgi:transcriptional regulator with XRE-family HTH domain
MEPDYARAFRIIRAAFGLKQSELAARMSISVSQLSLIEAGKRNATDSVIDALSKAVKIPTELVHLLAADREDMDEKSNREIVDAAHVLLRLLVPDRRPTTATRPRKTA